MHDATVHNICEIEGQSINPHLDLSRDPCTLYNFDQREYLRGLLDMTNSPVTYDDSTASTRLGKRIREEMTKLFWQEKQSMS